MSMPRLVVVLGLAFLALGAAPRPPWQAVCAATEAETLRHLFASPECRAGFFAVYDVSDVAETHAWMVENRSCFKEWAHFAWIAYAANDSKMADLAWEQQLHMARERVGGDVEATLVRGEATSIGSEAAELTSAFLDEVEENTAFQEQMETALAGARPLCLLHLNPIECPAAMTTALNWMYPRSYRLSREPPEAMTFSMLAATRAVFTDTLTQRYATRMALHLLRAIASGEDRAVRDEAFYPMAVRFFEGDYDRLWNFIAVYSTRGAAWATAHRMVHADNQPLFAAMMVISSAMGLLDTRMAGEGAVWSYVDASESTCFQPKPYHYWMAGSFAYLLRKEGYSEYTSKQVARLLGAIYEVGSTTMGRDPDEIYFVPMFDPKVNRVRREISHHVLGSEVGISFREPATPAFDGVLDRLMQESEPLPDYSEAEMREKIEDKPTRWRLWTGVTGFYEVFRD